MTRFGSTDFFDACQKAGTLLILAPIAYLGRIFAPTLIEQLRYWLPQVTLVAVDDVWVANSPEVAGSTLRYCRLRSLQGGGLAWLSGY